MNKLPTYLGSDFGTAIVPIKYIEAIKALKACQTIDDANQWAGKAEALAAWAKIYKHDEAGKEARRLKLHAYRKMGLLAEALRPTTRKRKGASSLLSEHGLDQHKKRTILRLSRATPDEFASAVDAARGVAPTAEHFKGRGRPGGIQPSSEAYSWLFSHDSSMNLRSTISKLQHRIPRDVALSMRADECEKARAVALAFVDWFDELDRCLPKNIKQLAEPK